VNWSDIGKNILGAAPIIGTLLGGPAGAAVGAAASIVSSALGVEAKPDAFDAALKSDPDALAKVRQAELAQQTKLAELQVEAAKNQLAADTQRIQAVNATMQAEAKSEHWAVWFWRPFNGLLFAPAIVAVYFVLPIVGVAVPHVPEVAWGMWGGLLGVTAWHSGVQQRVEAGETDTLGAKLKRAVNKATSP
jgi:hypothetical protein